MNESLSFPEKIKRSKSTTLHPTLELNTKTIKQIGDYKLGLEIGSGAFGKVVLGKHTLTGEPVAIKILDKIILSQTPEDYELVKQEISILKIVKHKYIVQLYEILQTPQHIYIIMEYCEGKDLMDFILSKQRLTELESLKYFHQLINALFYLHSQNIAHRDIKIDNMLLDKNKDLKLVDFGLSTKYSDEVLLDQPCGTVVYAAPEVLEGNDYHGMLADVWSSGIVLFGMVSGYLPFSDKDDEVNKKDVLEGKIDIPEFFSPLLKDLLKHMLDINPINRYTLQEIKQHPWFNLHKSYLIPGIIIGYNNIPVDENILNLCVAYNADKEKVEQSVKNNKYDRGSALYYLLVKKIVKKGFQSISDLSSDAFIEFILNDENLIDRRKIKRNNYNNFKTKDKLEDNNPLNNVINIIKANNFINDNNISSTTRNMENLSPAPRLLPLENNDNNKTTNNEKKRERKEVLVKQKRRNKLNSIIKNNEHKYITKHSGDISTKKPFISNKNEIRINQDKNYQRRLNNSANLRTKYLKKVNEDKYDRDTVSVVNEQSNIIKSKVSRNNPISSNCKENCSLEFKSGTEVINVEIKENKIKNKKEENKESKTPIKNNKKYLKQSTLEIYRKSSNNVKNKHKKNKNSILKNEKEKEKNSMKNTENIKTKSEKYEEYIGNSCINIKTNNYLKTPLKINNYQMKNTIRNSLKNIYNNERNINKIIFNKKNNFLNSSTSDKLTNLKQYTKSKPTKKISESIHSIYNTKYNESKIKDESIILFSSNKKGDYSLYDKKINVTSILGLNHNRLQTVESKKVKDLYNSSKLFLSVKHKNSSKNSLNFSLNKSTSNNSNRINNKIFPLGTNKKKQTELQIENTIYEHNNKKSKNKNRIRLDYNPNRLYDLTSVCDEPKKKNRMNKSVTIGKTDDKKITGLSKYMNNYNKQRTKNIKLESSVLTSRKIYGYSIRDYSYSPKQKNINEKSRKERTSWKNHKKSIDSKLTTETIYNKYLNKLNKNPLNPNGNKKLKMQKKRRDLLHENNSLINKSVLQSITNDIKVLHETERQNQKEAKEKRRLSQEKRRKRLNNHQRDKSNSIRNIKEKNKLSAKKLYISISTKSKLKFLEQILDKRDNTFNVFDLSCLVIKDQNMKECNQNISKKLKKNGFNVFNNKVNEIKCSKNKINCKIDIITIKSNNIDKNVFCYKINNKRIETNISKILSKIMASN